MSVTVSAETDMAVRIVAWDWSGAGEGHVCRPGMVAAVSLLAHADVAGGAPLPPSTDPPASIGGGNDRNALPIYDVPVRSAVSTVVGSTIRTSAIRSLGAFLNVVAIEGMIDEIATAAGIDPAAMRLEYLSEPRAREVLLRALELAGDCAHGLSRGIGVARYKGTGAWCAVVADIAAEVRVDVRSLAVVADVGRVASRDGVLNQLEGGALQAMSWTLLEQAPIRDGRVTATAWSDYPILRFPEVPRVISDVIDRPDEAYLGAGEAAAGPTGAAICNALASAIGVRVTELPLTPEAIIRALS
jgi:CO/xanthine dehydrogenase Mo-binding subunit